MRLPYVAILIFINTHKYSLKFLSIVKRMKKNIIKSKELSFDSKGMNALNKARMIGIGIIKNN